MELNAARLPDWTDIENYATTRMQRISFRTSDCGGFMVDAGMWIDR